MGLFNRIRSLFVRNSTLRMPDEWFFRSLGGQTSDSGVLVNQETALTLAWVWQATNIISNDVGRLPLVLYNKADPRQRERAISHPAFRLMKHRPNKFMSAKTLKSVLTCHALLRGNGVAAIIRDGRGAPMEILPLDPNRTRLELVGTEPVYLTKFGDDDTETPINFANVLHIKGLGQDGYWGHDVITLARNSWGLGLAAEKHGARTFRNNARPSVVLESDQPLDSETAERILSRWEQMHAGVDNAAKTALLTAGMKANVISMSNENSQWLESRRFQRDDVASWFCLPPHKLGSSDKASYRGLEAENRAYIDQTLMNWLTEWEQECTDKLLTDRQKSADTHQFEFLTAGLLRADLLTRYQSYQIGIASEFLSPNEVRLLENMPARDDDAGDTYQNPNTKSGGGEPTTDDEPVITPVPEPEEETEEEEETAAADARPAFRTLLADRMARMIRLETQKAKAAAARSDNFVAWIDKFYGSFRDSVYEALEPCIEAAKSVGLASPDLLAWDVAERHVENSKRKLLDVAGESYADSLLENITKETDNWASRAESFANVVLTFDPEKAQ